VGRQLFGIVLSLIGMLVTTRLLGPHKYGQVVIVAGLAGYAINIGKLGLDVYLIRFQGDLDQRQVGVTQGLYLVTGFLFAAAMVTLGPVVSWWYSDPLLCDLFRAYAIITPLTLMGSIPVALLDRQLSYKQAAMTELWGQLLSVAFSVAIVWTTRSLWGVVIGTLAQALTTLVLGTCWSKMPFRPRWNALEAKAQLRYGFGYCASMWIWQARDLVNPLLVGKLLGPEAAAFIAMAVRLAGLVGFAKTAVWRVYMSYLARLADDRDKMMAAMESGLSHQVLVTGVSFVAFLAISPDLIQGVLGQRWMPVLQVFPFIAAGVIANSGFSLYSSALYIDGKNHDVSLFHIAHIVLFASSVWFFTNQVGSIAAYGFGEVAALASYLVIRQVFRKRFFPVREGVMLANLAFFFTALVLVMQFLSEPLWLRLAISALLMLVILCAVPRNRSNCLMVVNLARQRFAGNL